MFNYLLGVFVMALFISQVSEGDCEGMSGGVSEVFWSFCLNVWGCECEGVLVPLPDTYISRETVIYPLCCGICQVSIMMVIELLARWLAVCRMRQQRL